MQVIHFWRFWSPWSVEYLEFSRLSLFTGKFKGTKLNQSKWPVNVGRALFKRRQYYKRGPYSSMYSIYANAFRLLYQTKKQRFSFWWPQHIHNYRQELIMYIVHTPMKKKWITNCLYQCQRFRSFSILLMFDCINVK